MKTWQERQTIVRQLSSDDESRSTRLTPGIGLSPKTLVWTKNKARLYRYDHPAEVSVKERTPLLIIYALINKPYILDLLPERSFIRYLVKQGRDVYLLDWGIVGPEDRRLRFDDFVTEYMPRAVRQVLKTSGEEHLNILGYCIGGILTLLYAALFPDAPLSSMILLATPVDFSEAGLLGRWHDPRYYDVDKLVDTIGNVPAVWMGNGARLLGSFGAAALLQENAEDPLFAQIWEAMTLWGAENVPFPGEAFRQWIKDFYQGNKLITDQLLLAGQRVHLSKITTPILNLSAESDHLVPLSQITPLFDKVSSAEKALITIPGSHFGLVISQRAVDDLWPKVGDWLTQHSCLSGVSVNASNRQK